MKYFSVILLCFLDAKFVKKKNVLDLSHLFFGQAKSKGTYKPKATRKHRFENPEDLVIA